MIEISKLEFAYPRSNFRLDIDKLQIGQGEKVAFVGPSGSGKTTLLNLIAGISTPRHGTVEVNGALVSDLSDAGRRDFRIANIGLVFQRFELVDYLRVIDNIVLPYLINRSLTLTPAIKQEASELARSMELGDKLHRWINQLSQGEQQRVAICRALLTRPSLLLADEPTGSLDPANKRRILDILFQRSIDHGATLVAVTHDTGILDGFDRVVDFLQFQSESGS